MIEREITRDDHCDCWRVELPQAHCSRGRRPLHLLKDLVLTMASHNSALHLYLQDVPVLFHINRAITNHPAKTAAGFFPMKYLAGIQGHRQVEVWRLDSRQVHWWIEQSGQSGLDLDVIL